MPTLHYFPVRGRGEMLRLAYLYKGIELEEVAVDFNAMKSDLALYPFGQSPRCVRIIVRVVSIQFIRVITRPLHTHAC
jgi:hypothetical protein